MPLIKGMLLSYADPLLGAVPVVVPFQYNPTTLTRVFTTQSGGGEKATRSAARPAAESYALQLLLDATDGLEKDGPLTAEFGIGPRLAALEMLMQPVGSSLFGRSAGAAIPAGKPPLTIFAWGPGRITPVEVKSLTIRETAFDRRLNPLQASVDVGLTVLSKADLPKDEKFARVAAEFYQGLREAKAVLQLPQMIELGG